MKTKFVRRKTRKFVNFISKPFIYFKFNPNLISVMSLFAIVAFYPLLDKGYFIFASLMILLNGLFDVIDGNVARARGKSSKFGQFLDRTIDKVSDSLILAAFMVYGLISIPLGLYTLITMFLATNVTANMEGVLNLKISDAVSMRFFRTLILIVGVAIGQFWIMFVKLAIISSYSLFYRFGLACYLYYIKK